MKDPIVLMRKIPSNRAIVTITLSDGFNKVDTQALITTLYDTIKAIEDMHGVKGN